MLIFSVLEKFVCGGRCFFKMTLRMEVACASFGVFQTKYIFTAGRMWITQGWGSGTMPASRWFLPALCCKDTKCEHHRSHWRNCV